MQLSSISILLVVDEKELADLYGEFASSCGVNVVSYTKPFMALKHYKQNLYKYSLVITDLIMPKINGIEFANEIRRLGTSIMIILMIPFDVVGLEEMPAYHSAKISKILKKPIKINTFRKIIQTSVQIP